MKTLHELAGPPAKTLAEQITKSQEHLGLTDDQLAEELGFDSAKVVEGYKKGLFRFPINKAYRLATALDLEPAQVMRMVLEQADSSILREVERCLGPLNLTAGEVRLINALRERAQGKGIAPIMFDGDSVLAVLVMGEG